MSRYRLLPGCLGNVRSLQVPPRAEHDDSSNPMETIMRTANNPPGYNGEVIMP
jgi:hypothetical protein